jgi:hypothetical protein
VEGESGKNSRTIPLWPSQQLETLAIIDDGVMISEGSFWMLA